jgi:ComF family protein
MRNNHNTNHHLIFMPTLLREQGKGLLQILYPASCFACGGAVGKYSDRFCHSCRKLLTSLNAHACPRCAATVGPFVDLENGCMNCRKESFPFERVVRLGPYEDPLREIVLRIKHLAGEDLAEAVGTLWAEASTSELKSLGVQAVVPVPLHWYKRWKRGYNQSEALAHPLAAGLGVPCLPRCLRRVRHTDQQTQRATVNRRSNVQGAFKARLDPKLAKKSLLLVDDVMTSGSTAREAAKALKSAGAGKVFVAVLARAD